MDASCKSIKPVLLNEVLNASVFSVIFKKEDLTFFKALLRAMVSRVFNYCLITVFFLVGIRQCDSIAYTVCVCVRACKITSISGERTYRKCFFFIPCNFALFFSPNHTTFMRFSLVKNLMPVFTLDCICHLLEKLFLQPGYLTDYRL